MNVDKYGRLQFRTLEKKQTVKIKGAAYLPCLQYHFILKRKDKTNVVLFFDRQWKERKLSAMMAITNVH